MARDWGTWLNERRDELAKELRDQYSGYMPRPTSWQQWQADADDMIERMELAGCSCPSGDGSLRWPCPTHPPAATPMTPNDRELLRLARQERDTLEQQVHDLTVYRDEAIRAFQQIGDAAHTTAAKMQETFRP